MSPKNRDSNTIAYVGASLPSYSETFVYKELFSVRDAGLKVVSCSVFVTNRFQDRQEFRGLRNETIVVYSFRGWIRSIGEMVFHPRRAIATIVMAIGDSFRTERASFCSRLKYPLQAIASLGLARRLRLCGVRHIHAHMANTPTTIAMYAAKQLDVGFSFTGHANDLFVHHSLLKEKLQRATFVVCISDWHRRFYQSIVQIDAEKLPTIRCGVDIPRLDPVIQHPDAIEDKSTAPFRILSVGRLVDKKGMDTLILAIARIDSGHPIRCEIIGDGPLKQSLEELIISLGLQDRVILRGACPNTKVLEAVRHCDVFVLACQRDAVTNDQDGIPVSLMEAMAHAKCVITTNLDPITELVIHKQTGWTVPERDYKALAVALQRLMANTAERASLATAGRAHMDHEFSRLGNAQRLIRYFQSCISNQKTNASNSGSVAT